MSPRSSGVSVSMLAILTICVVWRFCLPSSLTGSSSYLIFARLLARCSSLSDSAYFRIFISVLFFIRLPLSPFYASQTQFPCARLLMWVRCCFFLLYAFPLVVVVLCLRYFCLGSLATSFYRFASFLLFAVDLSHLALGCVCVCRSLVVIVRWSHVPGWLLLLGVLMLCFFFYLLQCTELCFAHCVVCVYALGFFALFLPQHGLFLPALAFTLIFFLFLYVWCVSRCDGLCFMLCFAFLLSAPRRSAPVTDHPFRGFLG